MELVDEFERHGTMRRGSSLGAWPPVAGSGRFSRAAFVRRMACRAALGIALLTMSCFAERTAHADLDLRWDAPSGCPSKEDIRKRLHALAGAVLEQAVGVSAEGTIARSAGRFQLTLLVQDGSGVRKRVLASDSCEILGGVAVVTLALVLGVDVGAADPGADGQDGEARKGAVEGSALGDRNGIAGRVPESSPGASLAAKPATSPRDDAPALAEAAAPGGPASAHRLGIIIRAPAVIADRGPLPNSDLGIGLGAGIRYGSWRLLLSVHLFAGQTVDLPGQDGAMGAELKRRSGQLALCRGWRLSRFEVAPCVGAAVEYMTARAYGPGVSPATRQAVWAAPSAGFVAHWYATESLALLVSVTGYLELSRPELVIQGLGEVARLGAAAVGAGAGLEWIF
jgi:hypothetical protein